MQHDQAHSLRGDLGAERTREGNSDTWTSSDREPPSVIAVASGKGGVGKTNIVANVAIAMAQDGRRVLAIDADLGLANLDLALGISPEKSFLDLVEERAVIDEIVTPAPGGICVLPGCSGRYDLANLSDAQRYGLFAAIDSLEDRFDTVLIDAGAGIGSNAVAFAGAAQHVVVVASPEPTSQADAYAFVKVVSAQCGASSVGLIANMVRNEREGEGVYERLARLSDRFLSVGVSYLGSVVYDPALPRCLRAGVPLLLDAPDSPAAHCITRVGQRLLKHAQGGSGEGGNGIRLFWRRLLEERKAS